MNVKDFRPRLFSLLMIVSLMLQLGLPTSVRASSQPGPVPSADVSPLGAPFVGCSSVTEIPVSECDALVDLYMNTSGMDWITHTDWLATDTPCSWFGVTCVNGSVSELSLWDNGLSGSIPTTLEDLPNLVLLELQYNDLTGSLPTQIGNLSALETLDLNGNWLSGDIPAELGQLTALKFLDLGQNDLTGTIPTSLGNLVNLQELYLHSALLTGTIPSEIGNLVNLQVLYIDSNDISGEFPHSIINLTHLTDFRFDCQLTSTDPEVIAFLDVVVPDWQNSICLPEGSIVSISGNTGVPGAVLHYFDQTQKSFTSDSNGDYSFEVTYDWMGKVIPALEGYTFTPGCHDYEFNPVNGNRVHQDFTASNEAPTPDAAGIVSRASLDSSAIQGNCSSNWISISANGRYVAFNSDSDNLIPNDTNGQPDVFVRDMQTGTTTRASVNSAGEEGNANSGPITFNINLRAGPAISGNGRYVAFMSDATNLVANDTNNASDIFVHDTVSGSTIRVSVDSSGVEGNANSFQPAISADGRYVAFNSDASNLVTNDTNLQDDVFVHDTQTGVTTRVSIKSDGTQANKGVDGWNPSISADGRYVVFGSWASNLVDGDANTYGDIFLHDMQTGQTTLVSVSSSGVQSNRVSYRPSISADGKHVSFASSATTLVSEQTFGNINVYVRDLQSDETKLVSINWAGETGTGPSIAFSLSADGRYIAFDSFSSQVVSNDTNFHQDVFVRDMQTGVTTRVSSPAAGGEANDESYWVSMSADGRFVAFTSHASNLVPTDTNGARDVFVVNYAALSEPPTVFERISPTNGSSDPSVSPTLEWDSSLGAANYEYCYDTSDDSACSTWIDNGMSTSATLSGLAPGFTYYWHVRANNISGTTYAGGVETNYWSFTIPCYSLSMSVNPAWGGSVQASPAPNCNGTAYTHGTVVTLTANASIGYGFSGWSGGITSTENPAQVTMTGLTFVTASFEQNCFSLGTTVYPLDGGAINASPAPNCPGDSTKYQKDTLVTLTAAPATGFTFTSWSGTVSGATSPIDVTMSSDQAVTATFTEQCYSLTTSPNPAAGGTITVSPGPNCSSNPTEYRAGTMLTLTANPNQGYGFSSWDGDASGFDSPAYIFIMADSSVIAYFTEVCYTLSTNANPSAGGTVSASPGPNCAGDPAKYQAGTQVTLTANPNSGYSFSSWTGDASGTVSPTTLTMSANRFVTGNFSQACYTLVTSVNPLTGGSVNANPAPNCNGTQYTEGTIVTLTAAPATGYTFTSWSGDAGGSTNPTTVTMSANRAVTADFSLACYTLTIAANPLAGGSVGLSPAPNCNGGTQYTHGTVVTVTATPNTGYTFTNWSGSLSGSTNPTTITMTADQSVTANFSTNQICYSLTYTANPVAGGTVNASPAPNCNGGTQYTSGTVVTLTASPNISYNFSSWSGAVSGTTNPTTVTMTANRSVTANFTINEACYTLTRTANPAAGGSINASPAPNCNSGTQYTSGTVVTLTAVPNVGYEFSSWSGAISGAINPTTVTMSTNRSVTANFVSNGSVVVTSITRLNENPTSLYKAYYLITFSTKVYGVDTTDLKLTTYGLTGAHISKISTQDEINYTALVITGHGSGALRLDVIDNDTIRSIPESLPLGGAGAGNGDFTSGEIYTIVNGARFMDVPVTHWAWNYVESLYNAGVTSGCYTEPAYFCPNTNVTRAQMSVFLLRSKYGPTYTPPAATGKVFSDIPKTYWAAAWIEQAAAEGISGGCGSGAFCPDTVVTRDQMAVFLLRAKHGSSYTPPAATGMFADVPVGYWAAAWIEELAREGITSGCGGGNYCPGSVVTRAQMSIFLVSTFDLPLIGELP